MKIDGKCGGDQFFPKILKKQKIPTHPKIPKILKIPNIQKNKIKKQTNPQIPKQSKQIQTFKKIQNILVPSVRAVQEVNDPLPYRRSPEMEWCVRQKNIDLDTASPPNPDATNDQIM